MPTKPAVHTPTPCKPTPGKWTLKHITPSDGWAIFPTQPRNGHVNRPIIAMTSHLSVPFDEEEANARHIVCSVNAHEALVAALRGLMDTAADVQMTFDSGDPSEKHEQPCCCKFCALNKSFAAAEAALALAE